MAKNSRAAQLDDPYSQLPAILTVPEVADFLRVGEAAVYDAIRQGLPHFRMGRLIRIPRNAFLDWHNAEAKKNAALPGSNAAAFLEDTRSGNKKAMIPDVDSPSPSRQEKNQVQKLAQINDRKGQSHVSKQ
jgi:excisionase family DNA binding protein